jgi:hypothetical protein
VLRDRPTLKISVVPISYLAPKCASCKLNDNPPCTPLGIATCKKVLNQRTNVCCEQPCR